MPGTVIFQHVRLAILKTLTEQPQGKSNISALTSILDTLCLAVSRAEVVRQVDWLNDNGFVIKRNVEEYNVIGVTITDSGLDIATGRDRHPEIAKPRQNS